MNRNSQLYCASASRLKLPMVALENEIDGIQITLGGQHYFFRNGETPFNSSSSASIARNKYCVSRLLARAGFPVPRAVICSREMFENNAVKLAVEQLRFPLVVKPMLDSTSGKDVLCNIGHLQVLLTCMQDCYQRHNYLLVEEYHANLNAYRVLMCYGRVIGITQRMPATVVGDGVHSIRELIVMNNIAREQMRERIILPPIVLDTEAHHCLLAREMTPESVPPLHKRVQLGYTCNASRGGTMKSLGEQPIHPDNAELLRRAAQTLGLNLVGFDVQCNDLVTPIAQDNGIIVEANHNPDLVIHEQAVEGVVNRVSDKILKHLILKHPVSYLMHRYFRLSS